MTIKAYIGALAAIVVIGAGMWYVSRPDETTEDTTPEPTTQEETAEETQTFAELMARTGSWRCEVETFIEEAPSVGVAHIADGQIRADFTSRVAAMGGQEVESHFIQTDGYAYTWSSMAAFGVKLTIPEDGLPNTQATGGIPQDARVEYSCEEWNADASLFVPPASIQFMEFGGDAGMEMPDMTISM